MSKVSRFPRYAVFFLSMAAIAGLIFVLATRPHSEADYQRLVHENAALKAEITRLGQEGSEGAPAVSAQPDLDVDLAQLWSQRFDDNGFRSHERLADKTIRVTGAVESISDDSVTLFGDTRDFGVVRLRASFKEDYVREIAPQLAKIEIGSQVTVQGIFIFEGTRLKDAVFVNRSTGQILSGKSLSGQSRSRPDQH